MAAEIFKVLSNLRMVLDTETDADSPDNETTYPAIRQMIEMLFTLCFGEAVGSLTSDPPNDTTGWAIDTGAGFTDDEHNGRTILFTSGDGKGLFYTIDDTEAANNRVECAGDNLYADGIRSGDDYAILYDIKNNSDGHDHDGINSKNVILADDSVAYAKMKVASGVTSGTKSGTGGVTVTLQEFSSFPSVYTSSTATAMNSQTATNNDAAGRYSQWVVDGESYAIRYKYLTASDRPFIYAIRDMITGDIRHVWACEDPPPGYWGLSERPQNFIPPIIFTDEHGEMISLEGLEAEREEIVLFNYPLEDFHGLVEMANKDKRDIHGLLTKDFEYDSNSKLFARKNLAHI